MCTTRVGTLFGGLTELIDDNFLYLIPLSLYVHDEGIDASKNLLDGREAICWR